MARFLGAHNSGKASGPLSCSRRRTPQRSAARRPRHNTPSIPPPCHRPVKQHQSFFLASWSSCIVRSETTNAGGRVQISQLTTSETTGRTSSAITAIRRMGRPFLVHIRLGLPNNSDNIVSYPNKIPLRQAHAGENVIARTGVKRAAGPLLLGRLDAFHPADENARSRHI